jgi:pyruvate dehydrogenase E1 component alpha subunit
MIEDFDPLKGKMLQILHPDGSIEDDLVPDLNDEKVLSFYREMVLIRRGDTRALALQRQGRMGTYAPILGQEAAQVGSIHALGEEDWIFPSFRELGVCTLRGVPLRDIYLYWMGDERGSMTPEGVNVFPISIPVGTHLPHAVGAAWAAKLQGDDICTIAYFGDGATSKGDFHEALNFAGVFQTPTIFFCQNNQYAISVPRKTQSASKTLAQKAIAYGFSGVQVDGNDVFAVYAATKEAREKAVSGGGPTLIEAVTYRVGPHTTADDPTKYRTDEELEAWKPLDPLVRVQMYLRGKGLWSEELENEIQTEAEQIVNQAIEEAESIEEASPEEIFRYTFEELTPQLQEQKDELMSVVKGKEDQKNA